MMTPEMVELLAWSGCHTVNVGIETANERLANGVLRRNIKMSRLKDGIRMLKQAGIVVFADNILGIPGGTLADDLATLAVGHMETETDEFMARLYTGPAPATDDEHGNAELCAVTLRTTIRSVPD